MIAFLFEYGDAEMERNARDYISSESVQKHVTVLLEAQRPYGTPVWTIATAHAITHISPHPLIHVQYCAEQRIYMLYIRTIRKHQRTYSVDLACLNMRYPPVRHPVTGIRGVYPVDAFLLPSSYFRKI